MLKNHELVPDYEFHHIRYERRPLKDPSGETRASTYVLASSRADVTSRVSASSQTAGYVPGPDSPIRCTRMPSRETLY